MSYINISAYGEVPKVQDSDTIVLNIALQTVTLFGKSTVLYKFIVP